MNQVSCKRHTKIDSPIIHNPLNIKDITFNEELRRLDIYIDFKRGSKFYYKDIDLGISGKFFLFVKLYFFLCFIDINL